MSYRALYRVWRPQTFDELVGQNMIAETLKNAVKNQQLSHAYLFTGPRGTGKTSAAKILAKAVNCPHQHDGNPCNSCDICKDITQGQLADVIEIDAASNNGVEEIRDLRDKVRYAPAQSSYKVYIIDEVHMLTTGAFNALLKTLEEPPAHVIFILATTEPHKIPATIISRTQRFDFQRITEADLINRMMYILDKEEIQYEVEALSIIARAANGGMRDSLSLLDQALSFDNKQVCVTSALEVSGSLNQQIYVNYILALYQQQAVEALTLLREQLQNGKQASRFIEELILFSRDMLLTQCAQHNHTLLSEDELQVIKTTVETEFYYQLIHQLNDVANQMRFSNQPELYLEVATIQLAQTPVVHTATSKPDGSLVTMIQQLAMKVNQLEQQIQQLTSDKLVTPTSVGEDQFEVAPINERELDPSENRDDQKEHLLTPRQRPEHEQDGYQEDLSSIYHVLNCATKQAIQQVNKFWSDIMDLMEDQDRTILAAAKPIAAGPSELLLGFENQRFSGILQHNQLLIQKLQTACERCLGSQPQIVVVLDKTWPLIRHNYKLLRDKNKGQIVDINQLKSLPAHVEMHTGETEVIRLESEVTELVYDQKNPTVSVCCTTELTSENVEMSQDNHNTNVDVILSKADEQGQVKQFDDQVSPVKDIVNQAIDLFGPDLVRVVDKMDSIG